MKALIILSKNNFQFFNTKAKINRLKKIESYHGKINNVTKQNENGRKNITEVGWLKIAKELDIKKEAIYEPDTKNIKYRDNININHFNIPDFLIEHLESLKKENNKLKEKLKKK